MTDEPALLQSRQAISDRQLRNHKEPMAALGRIREQTLFNLHRECLRLDMEFNEAKVEVVWECRMELVTQKVPVDQRRMEILKSWSEQHSPRVFAPDINMGMTWLKANRDLVPGLTRITGVVIPPRRAEQSLRGYRGLLLVVKPGFRSDDITYGRYGDFYDTLYRLSLWEHFSTWTETLP